MLSIVKSFGLEGLNGYAVKVEVDVHTGLPQCNIVGLASTVIKESKDRVRSAIKNSGFSYTTNTITVNLSPANIKKDSAVYDLPIAIGLLCSTNQVLAKNLNEFIILGELSLDGKVQKISGVLPIVISAKELGYSKFILPTANQNEASYIDGIEVYGVTDLRQTVDFLNEDISLECAKKRDFDTLQSTQHFDHDFKFVMGQSKTKRALEIAAAGGHNILMIGPPGSGKTMLAKCFPSILPELTFSEALEVTKIHSVAGTLNMKDGIVTKRPFRSPHHTATTVAITGGGQKAKPGEISLAHHGVLFLDELPEYSRSTLETMRQPLEDKVITVARAEKTVSYPANFILVGSMNPCPCGNYGSLSKECKCTPQVIHKYLSKLSGPLMDRIDIHIEVDNISYDDLTAKKLEEPSESIRERVNKARSIQLCRYKGTQVFSNSQMDDKMFREYCNISKSCQDLLELAFNKLHLSARAYNRILKVARTIADLDGDQDINETHILEAISYRSLDTKYWDK